MIRPRWIIPKIHNLHNIFIYVSGIMSILLIKEIGIGGSNRNFIGIDFVGARSGALEK